MEVWLIWGRFAVTLQHCSWLHLPRMLCNAWQLVVCLIFCWQHYVKTTGQIFTKIWWRMYLWLKKNWINFGSYLPPDLDPGIFWRILQHYNFGIFPQFGLSSLERVIRFSWKFITDVSSPGTDSRSRPYSPWRTDICGLWPLWFFINSL